jgi:hypothetical protein
MFDRRLLYVVMASTLALLFHVNAPAQSDDRSQTTKDSDSLRKQASKKEKLSLAASAEDKVAFRKFLNGSQAGLIHLIPRVLYENKLKISGGGAYYSFTCLTHEVYDGYGCGSHIELEAPWIIVNHKHVPPTIKDYTFETGFAGFDYGFIVMLGDVSIEEVTQKHDGVKFLVDYRPARSEPVARAEFQRARGGIWINGYKYASRAPVIVNQTYALRSIVYDSSDVLVIFRVVREKSNGSVVIVWKMLKRFFAPGVIRS